MWRRGRGRAGELPFAEALLAAIGPALGRLPVEVCVRVGVPEGADPHPASREALIGIAREAVTNAVKHAQPAMIEVSVEEIGGWRLIVRDDGRGFDLSARSPGFGSLAMRDRASAAGGTLRVHSERGFGTVVDAVVP